MDELETFKEIIRRMDPDRWDDPGTSPSEAPTDAEIGYPEETPDFDEFDEDWLKEAA